MSTNEIDVRVSRTGSMDVRTSTANIHISSDGVAADDDVAGVNAIDDFLRTHNVDLPPSSLAGEASSVDAVTDTAGGTAELRRSLDAMDATEEASLEDRLERLEKMLDEDGPGQDFRSAIEDVGQQQQRGQAAVRAEGHRQQPPLGSGSAGVGDFEEWDARKQELEEKMRGLEQLLDSSNASDFAQSFGGGGGGEPRNAVDTNGGDSDDDGSGGDGGNTGGDDGAGHGGAGYEQDKAARAGSPPAGDGGDGSISAAEDAGGDAAGSGAHSSEDLPAAVPRSPFAPAAPIPAAAPSGDDAGSRSGTDGVTPVWERFNALLREAGFSAVPLAGTESTPDPTVLRETCHEILAQFTRRGEVIQELILGSDMNKDRQNRAERSLHTAAKTLEKTKQQLARAETRILELREARDERHKVGGAEVGRLRKENAALAQKLAHSEHRVRAKEAVLSRLQEKLDAEIARDQSNRRRDRDLFQQLQKRGPRAGSKTDAKHLAVINVFEEQREALQKEVDFLRGEVRRLSTALRDKTNHIHRKDRADAWRTPAAGELLERLEAQRREHAEAAQGLARREQARFAATPPWPLCFFYFCFHRRVCAARGPNAVVPFFEKSITSDTKASHPFSHPCFARSRVFCAAGNGPQGRPAGTAAHRHSSARSGIRRRKCKSENGVEQPAAGQRLACSPSPH